ncbi:MAG: transporter permease subunit [Glaciihabitans sp.]|nr:transporter permease subunit [Glaciihabitans sp.]
MSSNVSTVPTETASIIAVDAGNLAAAVKPRRIPTWAYIVVAVLVLWIGAYALFRGVATFPLGQAELTDLQRSLNGFSDWVSASRQSNPIFLVLEQVRVVVAAATGFMLSLLSETDYGIGAPEIGWLGAVALFSWVGQLAGGWKIAVLTAAGFLVIGFQGLFTEAMATLALTLTAVGFSLLIGIPLGVWAGTNKRVGRIITPVLDFMQTMPTFVYLTPLALIFLIGPASAVIATVIYGAPPVIRLTALGVANVPAGITEAADSLGTSSRQRMRTVILPLARRSIVLGINQTTMAVLSMVTIAALIAAPGLGQVVVRALQSLNVGAAFNGGLAIVIIAIILDRITTAASNKADPLLRATRRQASTRTARITALGGLVAVIALWLLSRSVLWAALFPPQLTFRTQIQNGVNAFTDSVQSMLYVFTIGLKDGFTISVLNPFQELLTETPFPVILVILTVVGYLAGRWRTALLVAVATCLIVVLGVWQDALVTLASTIIATIVVVVLGLLVGVAMGRSDRVDAGLRPILDAAQTMPAFVYLVPFLGLFGPSRFTAIVAAVIYAAPVAIKIIAEGIRLVPPNTVEAAISSGSSPWQVIVKVQLPMAQSSIALAINQGLIFVLSMVVVGGLVGGGGLGYDVVAGFVQTSLFGKGLTAGLTIVLLGIILDGITQAIAKKEPASVVPRRTLTLFRSHRNKRGVSVAAH